MQPSPPAGPAPTGVSRWTTLKQGWRRLWARRPSQALPPLPALDDDLQAFCAATATPDAWVVDEQTWHDLDLGRLSAAASSGASVLGQHQVNRLLRTGAEPAGTADPPFDEQVAALLLDPDRALGWAAAFDRLRALPFDPTPALFANRLPVLPAWAGRLWLYPLGLCALLPLAAVPLAALAGGAAALVLAATVELRLHRQLLHWHRCRDAILQMLRAAIELDQAADPGDPDRAARMARARALMADLRPNLVARFPPAAEPLNLLLLWEYLTLQRRLQGLQARLPELRQTYLRLARLEAASTVAALLRRSGVHGRPTWVAEPRALALQDFTHPLIPGIRPLACFELGGHGAFVSGHNGVGKSTLLRSVGVNLVAARAFGHCFARQARLPEGPVLTSISVDDSPLQGHSLYVAQLRRARELLDVAQARRGSVVLIDEIFSGTNHLDAVSVAAVLLHELSGHAAVIVSSHHVVLATLLRQQLTPQVVARDASGRVGLAPGVLAQTNGIDLITQFGFTAAQQAQAKRVFDGLSACITRPGTDLTLGAPPGGGAAGVSAWPR